MKLFTEWQHKTLVIDIHLKQFMFSIILRILIKDILSHISMKEIFICYLAMVATNYQS